MKYLSKSRYKLATSCPTKLYYSSHPEIYLNNNDENEFLTILAEGGYQVGKLAELKFTNSSAVSIETLNTKEAIAQTEDALKRDSVIIFEAAFAFNNLLVRTDVLVKSGNQIEIFEVKAKSFSPSKDSFFNKDGVKLQTAWKSYLYDIAFQKYVVSKYFGNQYTIKANLTLVNKDHVCTVDGMQKYFQFKTEIKTDRLDAGNVMKRRRYIETPKDYKKSDFDFEVLVNVSVEEAIRSIYNGTNKIVFNNAELDKLDFYEQVEFLAKNYSEDIKIESDITTKCKGCEFNIADSKLKDGHKSGRWECFKKAWNLKEEDKSESLLFDLAGGISSKELFSTLVSEKRYLLKQVNREDLYTGDDKKRLKKGEQVEDFDRFSSSDRRATQCEAELHASKNYYLKEEGLKQAMLELEDRYPLHFIDFETIAAAIPHHKGIRPYQVIAFQYSHHILHKDGKREHKGEWINIEKGSFPSFEFIRNLKKEVEDCHPIFRYSNHENTVLVSIMEMLKESSEPDREELISFILSITEKNINEKNRKKDEPSWQGENSMIDLCKWIKYYYYNPLTKGSNSIKKVLPAVMNTSEVVKKKYSEPYESKNFPEGIVWYKLENGKALDPYKLLPPIDNRFLVDESEMEDEDEGEYDVSKSINSGGPAMAAYAEMQIADLSKEEFDNIKKALLRYCELDTLAMVMVFEHLRELVG